MDRYGEGGVVPAIGDVYLVVACRQIRERAKGIIGRYVACACTASLNEEPVEGIRLNASGDREGDGSVALAVAAHAVHAEAGNDFGLVGHEEAGVVGAADVVFGHHADGLAAREVICGSARLTIAPVESEVARASGSRGRCLSASEVEAVGQAVELIADLHGFEHGELGFDYAVAAGGQEERIHVHAGGVVGAAAHAKGFACADGDFLLKVGALISHVGDGERKAPIHIPIAVHEYPVGAVFVEAVQF